ncbi:MAG: cyclic nucleotide-binding domain-containing protein [Anaerolineae bacterium]|nr:cyclic nucleotide-binding domain-containing protein [Anaerolineae bacterium]
MTPESIDQLAETLKQSFIFKSVSVDDLKTMIRMMKAQTFSAGTILFHKGDAGDTMYVLLKGKLRIFTTDNVGNELTLTNYEPIRVFGDFSMLDQRPRSASATALENIDVLALTRDDFMRLLPECPDLGMAMIRNLTERVRHITNYMMRVNAFAEQIGKGDYEKALQEIALSSDDDEIQGLIAAYAEMVRSLQRRQSSPRVEVDA